jgi:hypothetical protein
MDEDAKDGSGSDGEGGRSGESEDPVQAASKPHDINGAIFYHDKLDVAPEMMTTSYQQEWVNTAHGEHYKSLPTTQCNLHFAKNAEALALAKPFTDALTSYLKNAQQPSGHRAVKFRASFSCRTANPPEGITSVGKPPVAPGKWIPASSYHCDANYKVQPLLLSLHPPLPYDAQPVVTSLFYVRWGDGPSSARSWR